MGSSNIQCIASRQVITPGARCYFLPLQQQCTFHPVEMEVMGKQYSRYGIGTDVVDSDAFWSPLSAFISGRYDDYGRMEPDDTPLNRRVMLEFFFELFSKVAKVTDAKSPDRGSLFDLPSFLKENTPEIWKTLSGSGEVFRILEDSVSTFEEFQTAWEYVCEAAQENRLFLINYLREPRPIQFAAIHGTAFDALISIASESVGWEKTPFEFNAYMAQVGQWVESARIEGKGKYHLGSIIEEALRLRMPSYVNPALWVFMSQIRNQIDQYLDEKLTIESLADSIQPFMPSLYAMKGMRMMNIVFEPFVSAGQDYRNQQGQTYARFVAHVSQDICSELKAQMGE